jgi:hypothetical protein
MISALKALYLLFWLCAYSYAVKLLIGDTFLKLKLKYFDYLSLLTVFCVLVSLSKMVWQIVP